MSKLTSYFTCGNCLYGQPLAELIVDEPSPVPEAEVQDFVNCSFQNWQQGDKIKPEFYLFLRINGGCAAWRCNVCGEKNPYGHNGCFA